ncbi:OmpA family protein [Pseudomonas sp. NPDC007930]|uniref:OmpA family protein n=1 Tax=Pseudomonas sp. NPDC007930 TaxID=3364417 RepID=UPI0036E936FB
MSRYPGLLLPLLLLAGCAAQPGAGDLLPAAREQVQALNHDAAALRLAPMDVNRASESLTRAERLGDYWGSGADVQHYAYLSLRYADIARAHARVEANQEAVAKLDLERQRLQLSLRESRLASVQRQGKWLEAQLLALTTSDADRGLVLTLGDGLFDTGEADLQPAANRTLLKLVQYLQVNPKRVVRIEGYTDNTGSAADNLALSRQRAQAVADVLADLGIEPARLQVEGYGDQYPLEANASEQGRALNRRVEVVISDRNGVLGAGRSG